MQLWLENDFGASTTASGLPAAGWLKEEDRIVSCEDFHGSFC